MNNTPSTSKKSNAWPLVAAGVLIGLGIGLVIWFGFGAGRRGGSEIPPTVPRVNAIAPDIQLQSLDGQPVKISEMRGRVLLVNFWATWCSPCRQEMPLLQAAADRYGEQLVVLAVNNDEAPETVAKYVGEANLRFPVLLDPGGKAARLYRVQGFPTSVFIDPQGVIRYRHAGLLNQDTLAGYLTNLEVTQ
jgi:cytochrome c biogenesis protein CcmG, thiol:disulfide interchange protein DsbE